MGKRKLKVGLAGPAKFTAYTLNQRHGQVLDAELIKKKKFILLELLYELQGRQSILTSGSLENKDV